MRWNENDFFDEEENERRAVDISAGINPDTGRFFEDEYTAFPKESNPNNTFFTKIVGVTYDDRQSIIKGLYEGVTLEIFRDFYNKFDINAIGVYYKKRQLGFLSKEVAAKLAPQIDEGAVFKVLLVKITGGGDRNYGVNIKITKERCTYAIPIRIFSVEDYLKLNNLIDVNIPSGVTKIDSYAFANSEIRSIFIPRSVEIIGECAFLKCRNLVDVIIENGLKKIEQAAFRNCTSLKSIIIPNSVKHIAKESFYGCRGLMQVDLSKQLESIEPYTFYECVNLQEICIPSILKGVAENAFDYCSKLNLPNDLECK